MGHSCKNCEKECCCNQRFIIVKDGKEAKRPKGNRVIVVKRNEKPKSTNRDTTLARCTGQSAKSGFMVTIRSGFDLKLPMNFFGSADKRGAKFNIKYLCDSKGQKMAVKWVKGSHDCNFYVHIEYLITSADKTAEVLSSFSNCVDMRGWKIRVVKTLALEGPKEVGMEPHIKNIEKFNTNTFWETDSCRTYRKLVLALAHFSYVYSDGEFVLTNLQGGVNEDNCVITLLPPTIVSSKAGEFGCGDLGHAKKFCKYHNCNSICKGMVKADDRGRNKKSSGNGGTKRMSGAFEILEE